MKKRIYTLFFLLAYLCSSSIEAQKDLNAIEESLSELNADDIKLLDQYTEAKRWEAFYEIQQKQLLVEGPTFSPQWTNLGPNSLDTLTGRMLCLTIHPEDENILFAGAGTGGLWKSENAGESWFSLTDDLPSMRVSAVAINPNNSDEILIGTGIGQVPTTSLQPGVGVLKSNDGGLTWETTSFSFDLSATVSTYEIVFDPFMENKVYLAATNGFYISNDGGINWSSTNNNRIYDIAVHPTEQGTIFIGVLSVGVQKSTNGGASWTTLNNGIPSGSQVFRTNLAICTETPETMVAKLINSNTFNTLGIYKTIDGGDSWTEIATPTDVSCQPTNQNSCIGWLFSTIGIAPDDPDKIFIGGVQFWYTHDGGDSWVWKDYIANGSGNNLGNENLVYVDHWAINFDSENMGRLYVCCDGGVIRSDDYGNTWTRMSTDLINAMVYSATTHPENPDFMIGGFHDHGLQRLVADNGNLTWTRWSNNDGIKTLIDHENPNVIYGNIQNGAIVKSNFGGSSTATSFWAVNGIQESGPWISPLVMNPVNSSILFTATNTKIYKTVNGAINWFVAANIPNVRTLEFDHNDPSIIYAHAFAGGAWSFHRSEDGGTSWNTINNVSIPGWGTTALHADPHQEGRLYATRNSANPNSDHIKVSFDYGDNWVDITNDFPDIKVNDIQVSPYNANHLFLATDLGVYFSDNAGTNWCPFNNNLPRIYTMDLSLSEADSTLRIATFGRGVWKTKISEIPNTVSTKQIVDQVQIEVSPNPTVNQIHIQIETKTPNTIKVDLYNQEGKKVMHLYNKKEKTVQLNKTFELQKNIATGTYYLKFQIGNYNYHKKIVIIN